MDKLHCWTISKDDIIKIAEITRNIDINDINEEDIDRIMEIFKNKVQWLLGESWVQMAKESIVDYLGFYK